MNGPSLVKTTLSGKKIILLLTVSHVVVDISLAVVVVRGRHTARGVVWGG